MNGKTDDPLAVLISGDAKAVDRKQLADLLKPFIQIDLNSKEFSFLPAFARLESNDEKIEILLAATKARALYFDVADGLLPKEIIDLAIMPVGSTKSSLKRLFDDHKIKKDKEGRYVIPTYRVSELTEKLAVD